ncbi:MAG: hypothetical protein KC731_29880 [Myxococcales bacterium]|nr:hypothetical protein [Myxococcales bacterium]
MSDPVVQAAIIGGGISAAVSILGLIVARKNLKDQDKRQQRNLEEQDTRQRRNLEEEAERREALEKELTALRSEHTQQEERLRADLRRELVDVEAVARVRAETRLKLLELAAENLATIAARFNKMGRTAWAIRHRPDRVDLLEEALNFAFATPSVWGVLPPDLRGLAKGVEGAFGDYVTAQVRVKGPTKETGELYETFLRAAREYEEAQAAWNRAEWDALAARPDPSSEDVPPAAPGGAA